MDFRTVQINSFKCSFPVDQVFNLVWQFEKLIGTKQTNKTRFTKMKSAKILFAPLICGLQRNI